MIKKYSKEEIMCKYVNVWPEKKKQKKTGLDEVVWSRTAGWKEF